MVCAKVFVLTACLSAVMFVQHASSADTIKCYYCTTGTSTKGCDSPFNTSNPAGALFPETGENTYANGTVYYKENCTACFVKSTKTDKAKTYVRACETTTMPTKGCKTDETTKVETCISTCDKDLCNTDDPAEVVVTTTTSAASTVRYTLLSFASSILLYLAH